MCIYETLIFLIKKAVYSSRLPHEVQMMLRQFILLSLLSLAILSNLQADPWGKDADLCSKRSDCTMCPKTECKTPLFGQFAEVMIAFHQKVISPCDGPRSHYLPSSSQYTLDAMRKYGFFRGYTMGCNRLMRENNEEWVYRTGVNGAGVTMKLDPVR